MSFLLPLYHNNNNLIEYPPISRVSRKKIGIFLSRSIYHRDDPGSYTTIINNLGKFLSEIANLSQMVITHGCKQISVPVYDLYLLSFCTDEKDNHDDRLINKDIYDKLVDYDCIDNVHLINEPIQMDKIIPIFNSFHMTICTRFHAHMFSLMTKTPILSIYTTRKVENLITELGAEDYAYRMETHPDHYYPTNVDPNILIKKFSHIEQTYNDYVNKLEILNNLYINEIKNFINRLDNLLFYMPRYVLPDEITQTTLDNANRIASRLEMIHGGDQHLVYDMISVINNKLICIVDPDDHQDHNNNNNNIHYELVNVSGAIEKYFDDFDNDTKETIVELISYELTGERNSVYHYGLHQQVFSAEYNLRESCEWILTHKYKLVNNDNYIFLDNNTYPLIDRKINIKFINNNLFEGYHRSGWSFVLNHLEEIHKPDGVIFDSYLDKTFGWEYDFLSIAQVIPYRKPWIGVFHHTTNQDYAGNNLITVFSKNNFIQSLSYCKGLIVLSKNNKEWIEKKLRELYITNFQVLSLIHPTEFVSDELLFDYNLFKLNPVKKIIQIGAWLRNSYAIYNLDTPEGYHKFVLKGKDMNNYFISQEDMDDMLCYMKGIARGRKERISGCSVKNKDVNKYIAGMIDTIKSNHESVIVLENISNEQYDTLLQKNIVFINLVDASAVNTILECIVRNTPILVNRLPAAEEYLGCSYPLFYETLDEVNNLLSDRTNIRKAHKYLKNMDKTKFSIQHFINQLIQSNMYQAI